MGYLLYVNGVLENKTDNRLQAIKWYNNLRVIMPRADVCVIDNYDGTTVRNSWDA